ncbi:rod-binding protein [Novosphingobium mangrovi (ex Huang et al. 2023)]|uniref:Rod-binding protein n=1 Tax=Novosphingobium mangrovi (ex Huang et al. 2023) TaxID=2976432 RepID=A0ABT2I040_9SPHN|nr:rod-binding protein [Novosphingobium mangrovi (ex Huang et al. 2023)]MCT2398159.1 rod-binding protein [Novosphingobium mangrovi (ex Huang et al. 2023)]
MSIITSSLAGLTTAPTATDHEKLSAVAKQFEALFMRQMLAAARKTDFGGDDLLGSQALDTFNQMQDEHFADVTAQTGTLGFATIIEAQMARFLPSDSDAAGAATAKTPGAA